MKFKIGDVVEQSNEGDLPCIVWGAHDKGPVVPARYDLRSIEGVVYENIPEYMMTKARDQKESKWGQK